MIHITSTLSIPRREIRFVYGTSTGPGGQHVNRVATKATLLFDVNRATTLTNSHRRRLNVALATRINKEGILRVSSSKYRSQKANRDAATERFVELLNIALTPAKKRKSTRVSRSQKKKRLEHKKKRSETKKLRGKVQPH
ncbi:MAG: aminoacyl-tRNA hydrolase [Phycisphaerae bacterium]|nr:aminoacyl-tRNA hydrolase [Phycisphaerae bacterium]MBT5409713.1 aminoacyl-tRNA hydrolase [Phycisphaerae bacterium]MBT6164672.1 aminoacyl-tRNA hydrolase [Phycisphaerae bacterium]